MTSIAIHAGSQRARLELRAGVIVPRLIEHDARSARVALVAGGALLLGGDHVRIDILVGETCLLELEDIGGTVAYDADGERSSWSVEIRVESGGTLIWHGRPLIVSDGADVARTMRIALEGDARACIRETVVLGRVNEIGGHVRQRTDIATDGVPVFVEEVSVGDGVDIPGMIGRNRVLDSVVIAGTRGSGGGGEARVMQFEQSGSLARYLGTTTHASPLNTVWTEWRDGLISDRDARTPVAVAAGQSS